MAMEILNSLPDCIDGLISALAELVNDEMIFTLVFVTNRCQ